MNLNCEDNKCLICNENMEVSTNIINDIFKTKTCLNGCIELHFYDKKVMQLYIFSKKHFAHKQLPIYKEINYWKENSRYLIKILEGTN